MLRGVEASQKAADQLKFERGSRISRQRACEIIDITKAPVRKSKSFFPFFLSTAELNFQNMTA
jgi:hypothetical protein